MKEKKRNYFENMNFRKKGKDRIMGKFLFCIFLEMGNTLFF